VLNLPNPELLPADTDSKSAETQQPLITTQELEAPISNRKKGLRIGSYIVGEQQDLLLNGHPDILY
jgi:hypothetical protein